jgi:DNA-3-methyladenine glycosylase II
MAQRLKSSVDHIAAHPDMLKKAAKHLSIQDAQLAPIIKRAGIASIMPHKNYYQELVESIVSQQLSVKAAATILKRFIDLFPGNNFPTPEQILQKDIEDLRSVGLSRQKGSYIQDLTLKVIDGSVKFNHLDVLTNDEVTTKLTKIKGVVYGRSTCFLYFAWAGLIFYQLEI